MKVSGSLFWYLRSNLEEFLKSGWWPFLRQWLLLWQNSSFKLSLRQLSHLSCSCDLELLLLLLGDNEGCLLWCVWLCCRLREPEADLFLSLGLLEVCVRLRVPCFGVEERESFVALTRAMALFSSACMRFWRLSKSSLLGTSVMFLYFVLAMRSLWIFASKVVCVMILWRRLVFSFSIIILCCSSVMVFCNCM